MTDQKIDEQELLRLEKLEQEPNLPGFPANKWQWITDAQIALLKLITSLRQERMAFQQVEAQRDAAIRELAQVYQSMAYLQAQEALK